MSLPHGFSQNRTSCVLQSLLADTAVQIMIMECSSALKVSPTGFSFRFVWNFNEIIFLLSWNNRLFHFVASSPTNDEHSNLFHCQEPVFVRWLQTLSSVQHRIMLFCYSFAFCFCWCWMSAFTSNYKLHYDIQTKAQCSWV